MNTANMISKKLKIAIIMSGAVSLGNFEAGVLTELFWAIDQKNKEISDGKVVTFEHAGSTYMPSKYEVDVITGASAGALNAALAASIIMNDYSQMDNLRKTWVEDAKIEVLLNNNDQKPEDIEGFLNSTAVEEIADKNLIKTNEGRAASFAPEELRIGFTLANLNGFDRILKFRNENTDYTYFNDTKLFSIRTKDGDSVVHSLNSSHAEYKQTSWDDVRNYAIASGCFPFAFGPKVLYKSISEYDTGEGNGKVNKDFISNPTYFMDGGTFNNQPVGLAISLANEIDKKDPGSARIYIFINAHSSSHEDSSLSINSHDIRDAVGTPDKLLSRIFNIIHSQSRTSDYLNAFIINDRISYKNELYAGISDMVSNLRFDSVETDAKFIEKLDKLAERVFDSSQSAEIRIPSNRNFNDKNSAFSSIREEYHLEDTSLESSGPDYIRHKALELLFYIIDNISNLENRKTATIFGISKDNEKLAGEQLGWFGGFFDKKFRDYNFIKGREITADKLSISELSKYLSGYQRQPITKPNYSDDIPWEQTPQVPLERMDQDKLDEFFGCVADYLLRFMDENLSSGFKTLLYQYIRLEGFSFSKTRALGNILKELAKKYEKKQ